MVDKLPLISTKAPSRVMVSGEFAHFLPGHSRAVGKTGTSYIDDFEGSKSTIRFKELWILEFSKYTTGQDAPAIIPEAAVNTGWNMDATIKNLMVCHRPIVL